MKAILGMTATVALMVGSACVAADDRYVRISSSAVTSCGVLTTHLVEGRLYLELAPQALGRDQLVMGTVSKAPPSLKKLPWTQFARRSFRFERRGGDVALVLSTFDPVVGPGAASGAVAPPSGGLAVLASLPIYATSTDSSPVVDASALFDSSLAFGDRNVADKAHVRIVRATSTIEGIEVEGTVPTKDGAELGLHWSLIALPSPMRLRLADPRVNFVAVERPVAGVPSRKVRYIQRWRLEKKDPSAAVSPPVQPITYYIDGSVPRRWAPYVRQGIEDWNVAFRAAGFIDPIVVKEPPAGDRDWTPFALRNNVVRWYPGTGSASGTHIDDPRTGEILGSNVEVDDGFLRQLRVDYFLSAGGVDPDAALWPVPDRILGAMLRAIVSHEIGHTLGFEHNNNVYPTDLLRNPSWALSEGCSPSVVGLTSVNSVAQPEDGIPRDALCSRVGAFDRFAIAWGYTPIPTARDSEGEKPTLDLWLQSRDVVPWLRWGPPAERGGDADGGVSEKMRSAALWLANLRRSAPALAAWTVDPEAKNEIVSMMYDQILLRWENELQGIAGVVGGPASAGHKRAALAFLNEHAFRSVNFLLDPAIIRRWEPSNPGRRLAYRQASILTRLLSRPNLEALLAQAALPDHSYGVADLVTDLRRGIWQELAERDVKISTDRMSLQATYLRTLREAIQPPPPPEPIPGFPAPEPQPPAPPQAISILQADLRDLAGTIRNTLPRAADPGTREHLTRMATEATSVADLPPPPRSKK